MNNGNGGNPGIQPWTNKYAVTLRVLRHMMQDPSSELQITNKTSLYYAELVELGIFEVTINGGVILNLKNLRKHSLVVDNELFECISDIDWARDRRRELGLIKGKYKGPAFRAQQQARRRQRRAYAKEQRAKRLAQPPSELPLSNIIFEESLVCGQTNDNPDDEQTPDKVT